MSDVRLAGVDRVGVVPSSTTDVRTTLSAEHAIELADWYARYALDSLPIPNRTVHPGVRSHLTCAVVQLRGVVDLLRPENDQKG